MIGMNHKEKAVANVKRLFSMGIIESRLCQINHKIVNKIVDI